MNFWQPASTKGLGAHACQRFIGAIKSMVKMKTLHMFSGKSFSRARQNIIQYGHFRSYRCCEQRQQEMMPFMC